MRKVIAVVAAVMVMALMASVCFAGQVKNEIINETLSKSNTVGEADIRIDGAERITFFGTIDNSAATAAVTARVTAAMSMNGTDWTDISWFDVAGGATPQTSEKTTDAVQTYVGWLDNRLMAKYLRIRVNADCISGEPHKYVSETAMLSVTVVQDR